MRWLLLQGWSFGPDFWTALRKEISVQFPGVRHDFVMGGLPYEKGGRSGEITEDSLVFHRAFDSSLSHDDACFETQDQASVLAAGGFDIALGHSLGFCHLLRLCHQGVDLKKVLAINGFTAFVQRDDWPCGIPLRVLQRMEKALLRDPLSAVHLFQCNAGMTQDESHDYLRDKSYNPLALRAGLRLLTSVDYRRTWSELTADKSFKSLILASKNDAIVPHVLTEACFGRKAPLWLEAKNRQGGHLLALLAAEEIVAALKKEFQLYENIHLESGGHGLF